MVVGEATVVVVVVMVLVGMTKRAVNMAHR